MIENIIKRLRARFNEPLREFSTRHIIFWHDAEGSFRDEIDKISIPGVNVVVLTGDNNFVVKKLINFDDLDGNYLIYNPISYPENRLGDNWLRDIELCADEPFYADIISERLSYIGIDPSNYDMRKCMAKYNNFFANKDRVARLLNTGVVYRSAEELHINIMLTLCGRSGGFFDVIKAILVDSLGVDNAVVKNIQHFGDISVFEQMLEEKTGYVYDHNNPKEWHELAAHIIFTAISQDFDMKILAGIERYVSPKAGHRHSCYQFLHEWQNNDDGEELLGVCGEIQSLFNLESRFGLLKTDELLKCDILPMINEMILSRLFKTVIKGMVDPVLITDVVETRRALAWFNERKSFFDCLYYVAKIFEYKYNKFEGFHVVEPENIWKEYIENDYLMDYYYRHFHVAFAEAIGCDSDRLEDDLKEISTLIENIYTDWYLKELGEAWVKSIEGDLANRGYISDFSITKQTDFYQRFVECDNDRGLRIAVIISDALRYEVAAELKDKLCIDTRGVAEIKAMQAVFPSITKFGMAALLPAEELTFTDKMDVLADSMSTQGTAMREAVLKMANENSVATTYDAIIGMKREERRDLLKGKNIVYIYHNCIDNTGENNEKKVFNSCGDAINEISKLCNIVINDVRSSSVIITADHGFLYTYNPLAESDKIGRKIFEGDTYEIGRRYALVSADTTAEYMVPIKLDKRYNNANIKGYAPRDSIRIKIQGGGANYVHGGISLQEMCVPVVVYKGGRAGSKNSIEVKNPRLSIISESRMITNSIIKLDFYQSEPVGEKFKECEYKLFFVDEKDNLVSDTKTVIANKTDIENSTRTYGVNFKLKPVKFDSNAVYRLRITNNIDIPEDIEFRINIAFSRDFD